MTYMIGSLAGYPSLLTVLTDLGHSDDITLCVDAGDSSSYDGSSQNFVDLGSGSADFYLGATSSATTDDPTFNGQSGGLSVDDYFSFDGGDFFKLQSANPAAIENLHKNNADFTMMIWGQIPAAGIGGVFGNNGGSGTALGVDFFVNGAGEPELLVGNGSGNVMSQAAGSNITTAAPTFFGISLDEAAGAGGSFFFDRTTTVLSFDGTYTSPSASSALYKMELGARGNGGSPLSNASRIYAAAILSASLTEAEIDAIYNVMKERFGL